MNCPYAAVSKSPSKAVCLTGNKAQVMLYVDGWKDLLSSVSLFGLAMLQLLEDCGCEIWRSCTAGLTLDQQTRWLEIGHRQCGHPCGWLCSYCIVSCGVCRNFEICGWFEAPCSAWDYLYFTKRGFIFLKLLPKQNLCNVNVTSMVLLSVFTQKWIVVSVNWFIFSLI